KTVITRAQFEKVVEALQPGMSLTLRRQLATRYSLALKMSTAAEKRGLDKGPAFEEKMYFARLQILSQELGRALQDDSTKVSDADLRARAVKGEDPDKLEKEAYAAAGLPGTAPTTKMEKFRRTALPANHQAVMDLKPGEVSELISDPNSGYYIYEMVSKETIPLDTVKPEILKVISNQRYRDNMQGFQSNVDLNDAYFGPVQNPAMPPHRGPMPPAQERPDHD